MRLINTLLKNYKKPQLVSISQHITSNSTLYPATCVMRQCSCILTVCLKLYFNSSLKKTRSTSYIYGYIEIPDKNDIIISFLFKSICFIRKQIQFYTLTIVNAITTC